MLPLEGIVVVAIEQAIAAPFCTRQLADLGAEVVKVERPGVGDFARSYDERVRGMASHFVWCNRSKKSLTLDLKQPASAEILGRLLRRADVFVQNLAPGAAARLGLSFEALQPAHPRLIVCDISGYGADGPWRDKKAYDLLIQAESGFLSVTGGPDQPSKAGNSIADIAAGMYAYSSILAALLQRQRSDRGCRIDISMLESMVEWMGYPLYYAFDGAEPPPRTAASHATICPYGPFPAGDGRTVILGLQNEREWARFCASVLGDAALAADERFSSNSRRSAHRRELHDIIGRVFSAMTADQIVDRLEVAQIANARINEISDVWSHPQLEERRRWVSIDTPAGSIPAFLPPGVPEGLRPRMGPVPALGEHTEAILAELGYDEPAINGLRRDGVI